MTKKLLPLLLILLLSSLHSSAKFDFNQNCHKAYQAIFDLRLGEARDLIQAEKKNNPQNGISILLDNYVDYFSVLASENKSEYEKLKNIKSSRLSALEKLDKSSPYYLFAQAEIHLQVGLLKSRFQDYLSSGMDIRKADQLLSQNSSKFPGFLPNKKSAALIDVVFGSIPSNLKGIFSTLGVSGNVNTGIRTLESLAGSLPGSSYSFYQDEVVFFLAYIQTDLIHNKSDHNKVMSFISTMNNGSLLKSYLQGYVSLRNARNDSAISYLLKRPSGSEFINFPALNYYIGTAKLNRMDTDANSYFVKFIKDNRGINYIKDAYLKLAYSYYLKGDNTRYQAYLKLVRSQGNTYDEKDKQALKEANDTPPSPDLLKARFYFDGGYYPKALAQLSGKSTSDFNNKRDQIEFHYRLGRIYDESGRENDALGQYQQAINAGRSSSYYFAANAALNMGMIYEKAGNKSRAAAFYKQAIAMKNHEYENSIETKAKDGLKRLGL